MVGKDGNQPQPPVLRPPADGRTARRPPVTEQSVDSDIPPAGPHADPDLTEESRTPGAGALPDPEGETSIEPGSG
jgi:hypothetical protein